MKHEGRRFILGAGTGLALSVAIAAGCGSPAGNQLPADLAAAPRPHAARPYTTLSPTTASASHTNGTYAAARAIDGNLDTEWQSGWASNPSLTLALPDSAELVDMAIKTNPGVGTYDVEVSEDGETWTPALTQVANTTWGVETKLFESGTRGRYLRLTFANAGKNVMVFDVQVKTGDVTTPAPSATPELGKLAAIATHTSTTYVAARAIDGNTDTEWQSGFVNDPALTITLPAAGELLELAVKANPGVGTYDVEVSEDGATFKPALTGQANTTWGVETKKLPAGTKGRYVRLKFANGGKNVMVFEATVKLGAVATPAPSASPTPPTAPVAGTSATHTNGSYVAARAFDGNTGTEWQSGAVSNPALTVDRGAASAITSLGIKTNTGAGTYSVEVSDDGAAFKTILTNQSNSTWNVEPKSVPAGTSGRFIRLRFANGGKNVMVFEVVPGGAAATPTPAPVPSIAPGPSQPFKTFFGNQSVPRRTTSDTHERGYELMQELGMTTIREGWNWKYVEVNKHQYVSWMDYFDGKANRFSQMGTQVQAMITDTPDWASSDPAYASKTTFDGASLGKYTVPAGLHKPMFSDGTDVYKPGVKANQDNYFADYIFDMVTRYKGKIQYWQVWNEPDFPSGDLTAGAKDANGRTRYWTGSVQDYVRLLKVAHTIVKGIDPAAKTTLGGLGYPTYLSAIIDNGGAPYFDVVDFHAYGSDKSSSNGVLNTDWGFLGRYKAMKQVLAAKGITGKTLACSETGFTSRNQEEQASYVAKVFAAGAAQGDVEMIQWAVFTNPGHDDIGIIDQSTLSVKTKGYHAYTFASRQLGGATPMGEVQATGVQGYRFKRADGKTLYVVWSTAASASLTLPVASGQVLDKYGQAAGGTFANGQLTLSLTPNPRFVVAD